MTLKEQIINITGKEKKAEMVEVWSERDLSYMHVHATKLL